MYMFRQTLYTDMQKIYQTINLHYEISEKNKCKGLRDLLKLFFKGLCPVRCYIPHLDCKFLYAELYMLQIINYFCF